MYQGVPYRGVLTTHAHRSGVLLSINIDLSLENDVVVVVDEEAVSFRNPHVSRLAIVGLVQVQVVSAQEARVCYIDNIPTSLFTEHVVIMIHCQNARVSIRVKERLVKDIFQM